MTNAEIIELIKMEGTATRGLIRSEIDRVHEMDKIRNGRIGRAEENIEDIKCETRFFRWAHKNPKWSIIMAVILIAAISIGAHTINVKRTIEKVTNVELKD